MNTQPVSMQDTPIFDPAHQISAQEKRQSYLTTVSKILADSIEYEARLTDVVRFTVASIADWCVINLLDDLNNIQVAALAHRDSAKEPILRQLCQQYPVDPTGSTGTPQVTRTGVSQLYPIVDDATLQVSSMGAQEYQFWQAIGYHSLMLVPLVRLGKVIGSFTLMSTSPERKYSAHDLALAEMTAQRIAIALENARLYRAERIARAAAEQAAARAAFLNETGGVLSTSLAYAERLNNLVHFTVPRFCDLCVIFVRTPDGLIYRAAAAHADPEKEAWLLKLQELGPIDPNGVHPAAAAMRNGQTVVNPDIAIPLQMVREANMPELALAPNLVPREQAIVPLIARQHVIGAISFGMDGSNREFSVEDIATAEILASRAALMIDNARLYREQQEAIDVRDSFLLIASHELKTPLTAVIGQAQLLQQRLTQSGTASERDIRSVRVIVEQATRLNKLIGNLLDVSRLSQGQLQISREPCDLSSLIERVVGDFQPLLLQHTMSLQVPEQRVVVDADAMRLEQVLQNLLQNALKYSTQGGTINIMLEPRGEQAIITVSGRGIGIPSAALPNLFQRFYRVNTPSAPYMSGIGIGLYVVHEIVTLHGGSVFVESTEGEGSSFIITLPRIIVTTG